MNEITTAYLAIGSNLGDRQANIQRAIALLHEHPHIEVTKISTLIETKALTLDNKSQPDYLNGAIEIHTTLSPQELLITCKEIEKKLGRKTPKKRWQPRPIDLDILLYGDRTIQTPELTIPHPEMRKREFVLTPLREIAPHLKTIFATPDNPHGKPT